MTTRAGPAGNIVLIGFMGSGKTEVGRRLAARTSRSLVDTDTLIEAGGLSIPDIFAAEGEAGFRRRERDAVARAARSKGAVIATGGGAVLGADNVKALKKTGVLVYLQVGFEELARRLAGTEGRPLLDSPEGGRRTEDARQRRRIKQLLTERVPQYEAAADVVVPCEALTPDEVTEAILRRLDVAPRGAARIRTIDVACSAPYRVFIGNGIMRRAAGLLPIPADAERACVVSHPRIHRLWGDALREGLKGTRLDVTHVTFPEGEERKTLETAGRLYRRLAAHQFHRSDVLVALGGGVVGDVTGFVASTYARGLRYVQVPTTMLSMVDAAIGGKTGFNLPEGKNLVGTFHHPIAVLADLDALRTLPERELRGGMAEVVKASLIADPSLGDLVVERRAEIFAREAVLGDIVERAVAIKARVVAEDERESGVRAILNYGHTLGHALEALAVSGRPTTPRGAGLHHGEAVAVGMTFAAWVSVILGFAQKDLVDEHVRLLHGVGLPTSIGRVAWDDVRRFIALDKKYAGGIRVVLLEAPGRPIVQGDIPQAALQEALARVTEG